MCMCVWRGNSVVVWAIIVGGRGGGITVCVGGGGQ